MEKRPKHPNKEIEAAICEAEALGWRYKKAGNSAHAWGRLLCAANVRDGCILSIWSTPKSGELHANQIRRRIRLCVHLIGVNYGTRH
jgi:hypothetical protein